ncbi:putative transmembrane protein [Rhodopirellula islandica]|uniref:Transmembrane protein n=2 Tax=Rhodopirellula islandica TaxID=595434 RepID=A0A0J1BL78_RHOIS|nr:putative transmembrane protein [Rhodopirellula islandica]
MVWVLLPFGTSLPAQAVNWEAAPIQYSDSKATRNGVAKLKADLESGQRELSGEDELSRLRSLLEQLNVPVSSQTLVFSKTSLQKPHISPETPRAIYFNDEIFVGYVQGGEIEIAAADPDLGTVFYTMELAFDQPPRLQRQANRCLSCHGGSRTGGIPGFQVRSVYPNAKGVPVIRAGSHLTNQRSPLAERWGGWYVTGTHGDQHHLGGFILEGKRRPEIIENAGGENQPSLPPRVDQQQYLVATSDITALMVMEHQIEAYNLLTKANFAAQHAEWEAGDDPVSESHRERIAKATRPLVACLCFDNEFEIQAPIRGTSHFASEFEARKVADPNAPSLRKLNLQSRLFNSPLSFLVTTQTFAESPDALHDELAKQIWHRFANDQPFTATLREIGPAWLTERYESPQTLLSTSSSSH